MAPHHFVDRVLLANVCARQSERRQQPRARGDVPVALEDHPDPDVRLLNELATKLAIAASVLTPHTREDLEEIPF